VWTAGESSASAGLFMDEARLTRCRRWLVHGRGADEDEANGVRTSAPCRVVRLHARPGQRRGRRLGVIHWARVSRSLISAIGSELYKQCVSSNAYQDSSQKIKMRIKIQELTDVIRITTRQPKVVQQRLFRKLFNREGTKSYYSLLN